MKFPIRLVPDDTNLPFMKWAKIRTPVSLVLIVLSFVLFFTVGVNEGIDFKGGTVIEVHSTNGHADLAEVRSIVDGLGLGDVQIQNSRQRQRRADPHRGAARRRGRAAGGGHQGARCARATDYEYRRVEVVGPRVSGELARTGTLAVLFTIAGIMAYIWFRFEWQFGVAAVATLVHDAILTVGFFAATQIDFNLHEPRRDPDDHRLFAQRHRRHLRPHPRNAAQATSRCR